jgi:hypothetical protein
VVEHKYTDDAQVYNVQSKVDNFIIGEYGTISKSDGQTIQVPRVDFMNPFRPKLSAGIFGQNLIKYPI